LLAVTVAQRTLLFTVLFPGTLVGLVPRWILHARLPPGHDWTTSRAFLGYAVAAIGAWIYVVCAREFTTRGRGTPAPYDPPRELVASGLYRWVRNPMYVGILSILAGEALCAAQAQHGSAPDIAGKDRANPTSLILSAAMLLEWLGEKRKNKKFIQAAKAIDGAVDKVLAKPQTRTADLGGKLGTRAFGEAVAAAL